MKTLKRSEAIQLLRTKCVALVDDEHSLCDVASRLNILCGGFAQWSFTELKQRHDWIVKHRPGITRQELEDLANRWQLARQYVGDRKLACDTQMCETHHQVCHGWNEFTEDDLARFLQELTGEEFRVEADPAPAGGAADSAG